MVKSHPLALCNYWHSLSGIICSCLFQVLVLVRIVSAFGDIPCSQLRGGAAHFAISSSKGVATFQIGKRLRMR